MFIARRYGRQNILQWRIKSQDSGYDFYDSIDENEVISSLMSCYFCFAVDMCAKSQGDFLS